MMRAAFLGKEIIKKIVAVDEQNMMVSSEINYQDKKVRLYSRSLEDVYMYDIVFLLKN
jgi:hypothetical protein